MMLPDLIVTPVVATWVSETEIEPSGWMMNVALVAVCGRSAISLRLFMITRSPLAVAVTEATWLVTVPCVAVIFSWYAQVSPTATGKMAGALTVPAAAAEPPAELAPLLAAGWLADPPDPVAVLPDPVVE